MNRKPKMSTLIRKGAASETHKALFARCFPFQTNFNLCPEMQCLVTLTVKITDKEKGNQSHHDYG